MERGRGQYEERLHKGAAVARKWRAGAVYGSGLALLICGSCK